MNSLICENLRVAGKSLFFCCFSTLIHLLLYYLTFLSHLSYFFPFFTCSFQIFAFGTLFIVFTLMDFPNHKTRQKCNKFTSININSSLTLLLIFPIFFSLHYSGWYSFSTTFFLLDSNFRLEKTRK